MALVGPTGAGKSTVAALLLRFLTPDRGTILVGGVPLNALAPAAWRAQVAWVPQQPHLFQGTVADNIRLARPDAPPDAVEEAARAANAHEFICRLPRGYDTELGEQGARLSGGQRQRIAIARAFLKDAPLLILDEATAHLDTRNEALIRAALRDLLLGRTTLLIAHRLRLAYDADEHPLSGRRAGGGHRRPRRAADARAALPATGGGVRRAAAVTTFRRLLGLLAPFRWAVAAAVLLGFATIGANVGLMAMSAYLISKAALVAFIAEVSLAIVAVRLFALSRAGLRYGERVLTHRTTFRILTRLRVWFYEALEPLAPARLAAYRSGDILARIVDDVEMLENFYVRVVVPPLAAALVVGVAVWLLGSFSIWVGATLLVYLLLTGVALPLLTWRLSRVPAGRLQRTRADLSAALVDQIQGLPDLLTHGRAAAFQAQSEALTNALHAEQERLALLRAVSSGLGALLTGLAALTALSLGIPLVTGGALEGVYLALLPLAAAASFEAVQPLSLALQMLAASQEAGRRLFEIIDAAPPVVDPSQPLAAPDAFGLEIEGLRFRYGTQEPWALDGLDLSLPAGAHVALVGPSGAGKSTLIQILLRFREYDAGEIRLGEHALRDYRADDVRRAIGVVTQQTHLFNTTIRDNLLLAAGDAGDAALEAACRAVQLHDFIMTLPDGYETRIGENGRRLSGGERQRLALARALLKDAPLLILDEATAHLDAVTEEEILLALRPYLRGKTVLFISHEARALRHFERVVVMEEGRAREQAAVPDSGTAPRYVRAPTI